MGETLPSMSHWPSHDNRIRPDVMVSREDGDALHIPVFLSEKDDSENRDEPGINVRLLKVIPPLAGAAI